MAQTDKYDILADAVAALRDFNQDVKIQTLFAEKSGNSWGISTKNEQFTPVNRSETTNGHTLANVKYAESLKIGKDISIRRIHRKPTHVKTEKNEYDIDNGFYYLVRTPNGEAQFSSNDPDFMKVWYYALQVYEGNRREFYQNFANGFRNEKLAAIAGGPAVMEDTKSKFEKATEQLNAMGIEAKNLQAYIEHQQKQNG